MKNYLLSLISGLIGGLLAFSIIYFNFSNNNSSIEINDKIKSPEIHLAKQGAPLLLPDFTVSAEMSTNAVVHVKTRYQNQYVSNPLYDFFFGGTAPRRQNMVVSSGSGVIVSSDGYIVTNNHVIERAEYIEVVLNDKRSLTATVVGTDATTDLALLKVEENDLPIIPMGDSDKLKVGEWVLAVGNPFNLTSTVTAGIVSAKARNINILSPYSIESFIQTDAAVNPGNSGGALVNTKGELVGINTAIASQTGNYVGYSFAIPVNIVKKIVSDIIEFGEVQKAYLGVSIQSVDQRLAAEKGLSQTNGVYIEEVYKGGAAEIAGLKQGDVITSINNFTIRDIPQLHEQLSKYRPGDVISVKYIRNSKERSNTITLKNRNNEAAIIKSADYTVLGAKLANISAQEKQRLRIHGGVKIEQLQKGRLMSVGIKPGFIITQINKKPVNTLDDAKFLLENSKGSVFIEGVYSNGMYAYYSFGL